MDQLVFYFDRNFGKRLPGALSKLRPPIEIRWHQGEGFRGDMPDDEWLEIVGQKGWVVLTQDQKFHLIDHEIEAIKHHSVKCFYFPGANDGMWKTLCAFIRFHAKMINSANRCEASFIQEVKANGQIKTIYEETGEEK